MELLDPRDVPRGERPLRPTPREITRLAGRVDVPQEARMRAADEPSAAELRARRLVETEQKNIVDCVRVQIRNQIDEHPQPVEVAVEEHNLAADAHRIDHAAELTWSLEVAIIRAARVGIGASDFLWL